jgi:hypothetical protein
MFDLGIVTNGHASCCPASKLGANIGRIGIDDDCDVEATLAVGEASVFDVDTRAIVGKVFNALRLLLVSANDGIVSGFETFLTDKAGMPDDMVAGVTEETGTVVEDDCSPTAGAINDVTKTGWAIFCKDM